MTTPGEYMKREREVRGVTLSDISKVIKVQVKVLKALEADDFDDLPPATFVKGFLRAYCKYLGLDDNEAVLRYEHYRQELSEEDAKDSERKPSLSSMDYLNAGSRKKTLVTVLLLIAGIIVIAAYYFFSRGNEQVSVGAEVVDGSVSVAPALLDSSEPVAKGVKAVKEKSPSVSPRNVKVKKSTAAVTKEMPTQVVRATVKPPVVAVKISEATMAAVTPVAVSAPESKVVAVHTLKVLADKLSWMRVTIDGSEVKEVMLKPGESISWNGDEGFALFIGNAGGVEIFFDGEPMGRPGKVGDTARLKFPSD